MLGDDRSNAPGLGFHATYGARRKNARARGGWTPLMVACQEGDLDVVSSLIGHGADVNAVSEQGASALATARQKDKGDIVALLEGAGATR